MKVLTVLNILREGLLTPLHVIVLQNPAPEYVEICRLLLEFGANPNKETSVEFTITQEEKDFLDPVRGRNALQLLCMRPDLDIVDPDGYLIQIALLLAEKIYRSRTYNGFSYLTLAMLNSNTKLLNALLESELFNVNETLQKDRGTALHVLVSTELQKRNHFPASINMCDMLLNNGANPLKTFKEPKRLLGNCVDYGYREIAGAKEARKSITSAVSRKSEKSVKEKGGKEKGGNDKGGKEKGGNDKGGKEKNGKDKGGKESSQDYLQDHIKVVEYLEQRASEISESKKTKKNASNKNETLGKGDKDKKGKDDRKTGAKDGKEGEGKNKKNDGMGGDGEDTKGDGKDKNKETGDGMDNKKGVDDKKGKKWDEDEGNDTKRGTDREKDRRRGTDEEIDDKKRKNKGKDLYDKAKKDKTNEQDKKRSKPDDKLLKYKPEDYRKRGLIEKQQQDKRESSTTANCSETFPEKIRQTILQVYGHCIAFDVNELLVPYVVLRDGELYYKFKGNTKSQEQYSLI